MTSLQGRNSTSRRRSVGKPGLQPTSRRSGEAGANVIVDDVGYIFEAAFQDDTVSKGVNAAVADGCYFFSAGGNNGNLNDGTAGVWEGDYAAGGAITLDGTTYVAHDFGGGVIQNEITQESDSRPTFSSGPIRWRPRVTTTTSS